MDQKDKNNLKRAWPFYLFMITLLIFSTWHFRNTRTDAENTSLGDAIANKLDPTGLKKIMNSGTSWGPTMQDTWEEPAPSLVFTDINGNNAKLSDHKGKNVILVFWATWCPPCKEEIPDLIKLRKEFPADQLEILAISSEPKSTVAPFAERMNINYTVIAAPSALPNPFARVKSIPTAFYIAPDGTIKAVTVGAVPYEKSKAIIQANS